jgi:hypothetical protein
MNATRLKILDVLRCAVLCCWMVAPAQAAPLIEIDDPKGDDNGAGGLIYPNRDDIGPGDLDLVRMTAEQRDDGVWFAIEMAQPIRSPVGRVTETGQTPIDRIARNGFYTFNVDIYVDTDRIAGLGETSTLPGRGVTVDRNYAWEKAIVLTPRPDVVATMLQMHYDNEFEAELRARQGRVSKAELQELQGRSETRVRDLYFFPDKVRVNGRRIEFLVPVEFLGGVPSQSWGYTALVTGADLEQTGRPGQLGAGRSKMMTMGVGRGVQESLFGIRGDADAATPPVVDILSPDDEVQSRVLDDFDVVAGRLAAVPGVAPDGKQAVAATGTTLTMEQAARIDSTAGGSAGNAAAGTPPTTEKRTVPARLRTLNQLLEDGLITEAEFNELRRKILAEL